MSAKDFLTVILFVALIALLPGTGYCTSVLQQDFSAYPSGTYLSDAGWTMAGGYCGNCTIQITDASGFGPDVNAVTGATAAGRCGFISAYRNFTSAVPSGNSLVLTSQIYIHPNLFWVWDGFWDGTVAGGDNGDPRAEGADMIDWIEQIPFGETRNYVQRVIENLMVYRSQRGDPAPDPVR